MVFHFLNGFVFFLFSLTGIISLSSFRCYIFLRYNNDDDELRGAVRVVRGD